MPTFIQVWNLIIFEVIRSCWRSFWDFILMKTIFPDTHVKRHTLFSLSHCVGKISDQMSPNWKMDILEVMRDHWRPKCLFFYYQWFIHVLCFHLIYIMHRLIQVWNLTIFEVIRGCSRSYEDFSLLKTVLSINTHIKKHILSW